jgi:hypothetical protein
VLPSTTEWKLEESNSMTAACSIGTKEVKKIVVFQIIAIAPNIREAKQPHSDGEEWWCGERMSKDWSLGPECELRCEVKAKEVLILSLIEGTGEIFGVEMAVNRKYCFHDENIAVYNWRGCKLRTEGNCEAIYTSHETPMVNVININAQLEARRDVALANNDHGPRVISLLLTCLTHWSLGHDRWSI